MKTESEIQRNIMLAAPRYGVVLWRNNSGVAYNPSGRPVRIGLCRGSADLIGILPDGRFLAVEVKTPAGRVSKAQRTFLDAVNNHGGVGIVARSVFDFLEVIG